MIEGTTSRGFAFRVPEGLKQDASFLRSMARIDNAELSSSVRMEAIFEVVEAVFNNKKEEERFYRFLASKSDTGRANITEVYEELSEIIKICSREDEGIKKQ